MPVIVALFAVSFSLEITEKQVDLNHHTFTLHTHKLVHLISGCFFLTGWFDAGGGAYISVVKFRLGLLYLYLRFVFVFAYLCFLLLMGPTWDIC